MANNRRSFLKQGAALAGAGVVPDLTALDDASAPFPKEAVILFQGDSITDGNRTRDNDWNHVMGHGYSYLISSRLWYDHPDKRYHFYNRGISGNKVTDMAARWQTDTLDIKPDLLSIMIGVNDVLAYISGDDRHSADSFKANYQALLDQTRKALPNVKLILCAPFVLPGSRTNSNYPKWQAEVQKRSDIAKQLAKEFNAVFMDFQPEFNKALAKAPIEYWIWDGVHPMPAGHELMARHWLKEVKRQKPF